MCDADHGRWMAAHKEMRAAFKAPIPSQPTDEEHGKINASRAVDEILHGMHILKTGVHAETWVAVPFAQIVEASVVGARSFKESRKGLIVMIGVTQKLRARSAGCVYAEVDDPK